MSKLTLTGLALPLFLLLASPPASTPKAFGANPGGPTYHLTGKRVPHSQAAPV